MTKSEIDTARAQIIANMHATVADAIARQDRRSETSRANLGDHVPARIDPTAPTVAISTRLPQWAYDDIVAHAEAFGLTKSEALRDLVTWALTAVDPLDNY